MGRFALVVDDSMLIRHTVCRFLEERGFQVHSASNGAEAWATLQDFKPDLIVTDLAMPKMSGSELITEIKKSPSLERVPLVVLAARRTATDPQQMDLRADFVVHKDIDIEDQLGHALAALFTAAR